MARADTMTWMWMRVRAIKFLMWNHVAWRRLRRDGLRQYPRG